MLPGPTHPPERPLMSFKSDRTSTSQGSTRPRCPVCRETVYSRAGIHPQCAVRQSEPPKPKAKPEVASSPAGATPGPAAVVPARPVE